MVTNFVETVKVPASFLVSGFKDLPIDVQNEIIDISNRRAYCKDGDKVVDATELEKVASRLPEKMRSELASIGALLPSDTIDLLMRLGDFLYHIYAFHTKPAQAPLAMKRHEKRLMDLASMLDSSEFVVPQDVLDIAESVLNDEEKWAVTPFGVMIPVDSTPKYLGINSHGASLFRKIMDAALNLFEGKTKNEQTT